VIQSQLYGDYKAHQKSDRLLLRNCGTITKPLKYGILQYITRHLERTRSITGSLLEQRPRKEKEQFIVLERGYTKAFTFRSDISLQKLIRKKDKSGTIMVQIKII
jgi:hypothetical protein